MTKLKSLVVGVFYLLNMLAITFINLTILARNAVGITGEKLKIVL